MILWFPFGAQFSPTSIHWKSATCVRRSGLCAGDIRKAAERLGVTPSRLRAFVRNSPWVREELHEARERILDRAEQVLHEALFSDDPKRRDSAARFILTKSQSGRAGFHALTDHLQLGV
jgi:hypothetical protein